MGFKKEKLAVGLAVLAMGGILVMSYQNDSLFLHELLLCTIIIGFLLLLAWLEPAGRPLEDTKTKLYVVHKKETEERK